MNTVQAAEILAPIAIAFEAARLRIEALREDATGLTGYAAVIALADLDAAGEFLAARAAQFRGAGLMTVIQTGRGVLGWPNAYPQDSALDEAVSSWVARLPQEQHDRWQAVQGRAAKVATLDRRATRKAAGQ